MWSSGIFASKKSNVSCSIQGKDASMSDIGPERFAVLYMTRKQGVERAAD
jgi:hypothetical protein